MIIRKCNEEDIIITSEFYDDEIIYLDNHINYPKWKYKLYPSIISVTDNTKNGFQYICLEDDKIEATFVLNDNTSEYNVKEADLQIQKTNKRLNVAGPALQGWRVEGISYWT